MTNPAKICFIYCVSDYHLAFKSLATVNSLIIPKGYSLERRLIQNAPCLTEGYNRGMLSSDAKYKVYIHHDVLIMEKNFLINIINLFKTHPFLGMIGVAGAKTIPPSGIWWEAPIRFGKVWTGTPEALQILAFSEVTSNFTAVKAIDGLIIITQYDLPWRTDLFRGWHFYDISHSLEFVKKGFQVGVPRQTTPWCLHIDHHQNLNTYDTERQIFLQEYRDLIEA
jgi:hypothetical protein